MGVLHPRNTGILYSIVGMKILGRMDHPNINLGVLRDFQVIGNTVIPTWESLGPRHQPGSPCGIILIDIDARARNDNFLHHKQWILVIRCMQCAGKQLPVGCAVLAGRDGFW